MTDTGVDRTWGQRLLAPIAEVRRDEIVGVALLTLLMFLILAAYYFLKTARDGGMNQQEARYLALSTFCQSLLSSAEFRYLN